MMYSKEYVLFSVLIVIVFFIIHWALQQKVNDLSPGDSKTVFRSLPLLFLLFILLFLLVGLFLNKYFENLERNRIVSIVDGFLPTFSQRLEEYGHSTITLETKENDPTYQLLLRKVERWTKINRMIQCVYTIRKYADGNNYLLLDTPTDYNRNGIIDGELEERTPIGEKYEMYIPELEEAFEGTIAIEPYPTTDKWGSSIGGFAPIYKDGKVEAVLGIDFDGKLWDESMKRAHYHVMSYLLIPILLLFVFYWSMIIQRIYALRNYRLAHYDLLTKLPNRLLFDKTINATFTEASQLSGSFSILLLDVDKFKNINDQFGHLCGDSVLQVVAERLISCTGTKESIFRISGDEFIVLLCNQGVVEAKLIVEKISESFHQPIHVDDISIQVSLSIGIAHYPTNGHSIKELIMCADLEMYRNKSNEQDKQA